MSRYDDASDVLPCRHIAVLDGRCLICQKDLTPTPPRWPTITVPAISIHHLKGSTVDWIRSMQNDLDFLAAMHDNGFFIVAPASEDHLDALPEDLRAVFYASRDHATHGWLLIDVDGDVVEGLPVYKD